MKKRRKLKASFKVLLLTLVLILLIAVTLVATFSLQDVKETDALTYNSNATLTPSICLKNNDFLPSACSSENKSYVNSLIDNIKLNLNGSFQASNLLERLTYSYVVEAETKANEKGNTNKVVYDSIDQIATGSDEVMNTTTISLNTDLDVNFKSYNDLINAFKRTYVIALDSNLIIKLTINYEAYYDKIAEPIKTTKEVLVTFPLTEQTVNMDLTKATITTNETQLATTNDDLINEQKLFIYGLYAIDVIWFIIMVVYVIKLIPEQNVYNRKLNKILKEYDRAIALTDHLPSLKGLKIITINSFDELLDVKDNLGKPILMAENKRHDQASFLILNDTEAYLYVLTAFDNQ